MTKKKTQKKSYAAQEKYDAIHARYFSLKLNDKTDADIIAVLDQKITKQAFIKEAIRFYIAHSDGK